MNVQLTLIESREAPIDWKIDEETRSIGRAGLRSAREALAAARSSLEPEITLADASVPADLEPLTLDLPVAA